MKDELITNNTAGLAKLKGFNEPCYYFSDLIYGALENGRWHCNTKINVKGDTRIYVTLPTQALLKRWLREVHGLEVNAFRSFSMTKSYHYLIEKDNNQDENFIRSWFPIAYKTST